MALPTNGSGGGLPKRPQPGQRDPRKTQGLPSGEGQKKYNPAEGVPSITQKRPKSDAQKPPVQRPRQNPPQRARPPQQGQQEQRPQQGGGQGGLPTQGGLPQRPRSQQGQQGLPAAPSGARRPRPQPEIRPAPAPQERVQNPFDEEDPFESLPMDDVLSDDEEFDTEYGNMIAEEEPESLPDEPDEFDDGDTWESAAPSGGSFYDHPRPGEDDQTVEVRQARVRGLEQYDNMAAQHEAKLEGRDANYDAVAEDEDMVPHDAQYVSQGTPGEKGQPVFVDEDNKKLKTFGGKRKIKVDEYDSRVNKERKAKVIQWSFIGLVVSLVVMSAVGYPYLSNTTVKPEEVQTLVQAETGGTGFPLNAGEGFATDFMKAYLTYTGNNSIDNQALQYYQTGTMNSSGNAGDTGRSVSGKVIQNVVYGPTVYGVQDVTPYSAVYTIGALVDSQSTEEEASELERSTRWEFFEVNVYFDTEAKRFYIPPESPTMIPNYEVGARGDVPKPDALGDGKADDTVTEAVRSTVLGFMEGWVQASPDDITPIEQYIVSGEDGEHLHDGLEGQYQFASGDAAGSVTFEAYPNTENDDIKVDMVVRWGTEIPGVEDVAGDVEYTSTYVMTLVQVGEDRYEVSNFAPKVYISQHAN